MVNVRVDESVTFQTIKGFGAFGAKVPFWFDGPFHDDEFVELLVNDLGQTIVRVDFPDGYDPLNGNSDDPTTAEYAGEGKEEWLSGTIHKILPYLTRMKEGGIETFIVSCWSPPAWMKTNGNVLHGGQLREDCYDAFAEHVVAYLKLIKAQCGIDVYAVSLQNEPAFDQPFRSCVYSAEQLKRLIVTVGKRFREEGIGTKLFAPEDIGYYPRVMEYITSLMEDEEARAYADIIAVHGYALDGVTADSPDAETWRNMFNAGGQYGKPLWMTETSGYNNNWTDAMKLAKAIYVALKYGQVSAWVWWQISDYADSILYCLLIEGQPTSKYYVSKQFYRYIRPGAVQVLCESDDPEVLSLAFLHERDRTTTYVLINGSAADRYVAIAGGNAEGAAAYTAYRTSADESCAMTNEVSVGGEILLPAYSVTTLYGHWGSDGEAR